MRRKPSLPVEDPQAWRDEPANGLRDALRLAREGERRRATGADAPPARPFPGPKRRPIPGQLTLDGDEAV
jgi:hypothetical protein